MADYIKQVNTDIVLNDTSTNSPISWTWDFGDGTTSTEQSPIKKYTAIGDYTITHTAINACETPGCSISKTIHIQAEPVTENKFLTELIYFGVFAGMLGLVYYSTQPRK